MCASEALSGLHAVREALRARRRTLHRLLVGEVHPGEEVAELIALARQSGVPIDAVSRADLTARVGLEARTQGVVLEAGPIPELNLGELRRGERGKRWLVALDGVEDPQNLGAIARVAEAAGVGGLLLTRHRAPPLTAAVTRASAGAIEHLPVSRVTNLARALEELQQDGFWTLGADPVEGDDLYAASDRTLAGDLVVVLGAEGRGLRPGVRTRLDHRVRIPMAGRVASLNVATAAGVVLFEILRRSRAREAAGRPG